MYTMGYSTVTVKWRWKACDVMELRKRILGAEHPDTLTNMGNLAGTYWHQGRWNEAEKLQVDVMELSKRLLGAEHPDTLRSIANLAVMYKQKEGGMKQRSCRLM